MKAWVIERIVSLGTDGTPAPLRLVDLPIPSPGPGEVLLRVSVCGVCHTELDEIEGRTPPPHLPIVPGHQVVGQVVETGAGCQRLRVGDRVGVAWIYSACGRCHRCLAGDENLCPEFKATGRDVNGGYAEFLVVREEFAHPIPPTFSDAEAAPLLCAGAVGYRALRLTGLTDAGEPLGLVGFGASNHLVLLLARHKYPRSPVFVFARAASERAFALELGAAWAGEIGQTPPAPPRAIIDTTPVWRPILEALRWLAPAGRLVINAIRKEDGDRDALVNLDYAAHLWQEKEIKTVANVTRRDVRECLDLAAEIGLKYEDVLLQTQRSDNSAYCLAQPAGSAMPGTIQGVVTSENAGAGASVDAAVSAFQNITVGGSQRQVTIPLFNSSVSNIPTAATPTASMEGKLKPAPRPTLASRHMSMNPMPAASPIEMMPHGLSKSAPINCSVSDSTSASMPTPSARVTASSAITAGTITSAQPTAIATSRALGLTMFSRSSA